MKASSLWLASLELPASVPWMPASWRPATARLDPGNQLRPALPSRRICEYRPVMREAPTQHAQMPDLVRSEVARQLPRSPPRPLSGANHRATRIDDPAGKNPPEKSERSRGEQRLDRDDGEPS